jgi:hypothetical protein
MTKIILFIKKNQNIKLSFPSRIIILFLIGCDFVDLFTDFTRILLSFLLFLLYYNIYISKLFSSI